MIPPFGFMRSSSSAGVGRRTPHRAKAGPYPLGAGRCRLIRVIRGLGIYDERIAARVGAERALTERLERQRAARLEEEERLAQARVEHETARLREAQWFAWQVRRQRLSRLWARERAALRLEQHRFVLLLKDELAHQRMTPEQDAANRLEEQVLAWLTCGESGESG